MLNIYHQKIVVCLVLLLIPLSTTIAASNIEITTSKSRVQRGDTVEIKLQTTSSEPVHAVVLVPTLGIRNLSLSSVPERTNDFRTDFPLSNDAPEGLYVVHAWTGDAAHPGTVGKATFLLGRLINDFFIASYVDSTKPATDVDAYLKDFRSIGGNLVIAHNLIIPTGALYASKIVRTDVTAGSANDIVELILKRAEDQGLAVLLSVSWDMTKQTPFKGRMPEIKAIATELFDLYKQHPSLVGFYSYQEGSGTYFVPFVREFTQFIKTLNPNLLTACAPHTDDPLLAGYLSTVEELDIIIFQAGVMASYRPDNRKKYPFRRVRDFCSLGAGAKRLQNKIALNHVELFGYLENRLTPETTATTYDNIYQQILSAATITNADGISFFTYHAHVYDAEKKLPAVQRSRAAVRDGIRAFDLITAKVSHLNNALAVYFPYSDWIIERWHNYFLPALDAFRVLGVPVDVLAYAPPVEESVYPYYPFHLNKEVLTRLLNEHTVLVLPNVSGFQQTDGDLIKAFVEQGGVLVAFGPQLPMSRSYERAELFGLDETTDSASHSSVIVDNAIGGRLKTANTVRIDTGKMTLWKLKGAKLVARFEDGSPAVTINKYGKGTAIAIVPDASAAAQGTPNLIREVLAHACSLRGESIPVDIIGANEKTDMAIERTVTGFRVALVNYNSNELSVDLEPTRITSLSMWQDLVDGRTISSANSLKLTIPARSFRAVEYRTR